MVLLKKCGRLNLAGRPAIYKVTNEFLRNCNISSVEELPSYNEMKVTDEQIIADDIANIEEGSIEE